MTLIFLTVISLASLVFLALFIRMCVWTLKPAIRLLIQGSHLFGDSLIARLWALGITAWCFPSVFEGLLFLPLEFVQFSLGMSGQSLSMLGEEAARNRVTPLFGVDPEVIRVFSNELARVSGAFGYRSPLKLFSWSTFFQALAAWSALGNLFSYLFRMFIDNTTPSMLKQFSSTTKANCALGAVLIVGSYLCMAAITAVSWLGEFERTSSSELDTLRMRLLEVTDPKRIDRIAPDALTPSSGTAGLKNASAETPKVIPQWVLESQLRIHESWTNAKHSISDDIIRLPPFAIEMFEKYTRDEMTPRERRAYADQLVRECQRHVDQRIEALRELRQSADADCQYLQLNQGEADVGFAGFRMSRWRQDTSTLLRQLDTVSFSWPSADLAIGPFGWICGWLIRTRSVKLALITGMVGFGILGASASTFVREAKVRSVGEPYVKELMPVFVRGVTAAITVFLSVEGGLAIFTKGEQVPNAYVLFFTCFVGAVFSEDVWDWAKAKLGEVLTRQERDRQNVLQTTDPIRTATAATEVPVVDPSSSPSV